MQACTASHRGVDFRRNPSGDFTVSDVFCLHDVGGGGSLIMVLWEITTLIITNAKIIYGSSSKECWNQWRFIYTTQWFIPNSTLIKVLSSKCSKSTSKCRFWHITIGLSLCNIYSSSVVKQSEVWGYLSSFIFSLFPMVVVWGLCAGQVLVDLSRSMTSSSELENSSRWC